MKIIVYCLITVSFFSGIIGCSQTMENEFMNHIVGSYQTVGSNPVEISFAINGDIILNLEIIGYIYKIKSPFDAVYVRYNNGVSEYFPMSISGQDLYSSIEAVSNPNDVAFSNLVLFATRG